MANAANNALSAYSNTKTYFPPFKFGAEFLERNIATPMANTVGTASQMTGVQTGVRWLLQRNDSSNSNLNSPNGANGEKEKTPIPSTSNKRRRESEGAEGPPPVHRARGLSEASQTESLPPYDDRRSPAYEEVFTPTSTTMTSQQSFSYPPSSTSSQAAAETAAAAQQSWPTRAAIYTSGLGVAMSDESLRSLKYCLTWLKWANSHLSQILSSLQAVLEEWERAQRQQLEQQQHHDGTPLTEDSMEGVVATNPQAQQGQQTQTQQAQQQGQPRDQATIAKHLETLKKECVRTLKTALEVVSRYAGGALPENARWMIHCHLTSLPARFRLASSNSRRTSSVVSTTTAAEPRPSTEKDGRAVVGSKDEEAQQQQPEAVTGAQRVVVLAREGLDMMAQVSAVVNGTIVSAEEWCERLGRRRNPDAAGSSGSETGGVASPLPLGLQAGVPLDDPEKAQVQAQAIAAQGLLQSQVQQQLQQLQAQAQAQAQVQAQAQAQAQTQGPVRGQVQGREAPSFPLPRQPAGPPPPPQQQQMEAEKAEAEMMESVEGR